MQAMKDMKQRLGIAGDLLTFLWQARLWWMMPIVIVLLLLGLIIGFGSTTGVGPFIYTLF